MVENVLDKKEASFTTKEYSVRSGIAYASGGKESINISEDAEVCRISVRHNSGSFTGGTTPTYVANSLIKQLRLLINGEVFLDFGGDTFTDAMAWGIKCLREFNAQMNGIADESEFFELQLPDSLPVGAQKTLEIYFNELANISDSNPTAYSGTVDVYIEENDIDGDDIWVLKSQYGKYTIGTGTSGSFKMPAIEKGWEAKGLMFGFEDNDSFSDSALSTIEVKLLNEIIFQGNIQAMQQKYQRISKLAFNTGMAFLPLDGRTFNSDELEIKVTCASGTNKEIHWTLFTINDMEND